MQKRLSPFSMNKYAFNVYSQFGEDGIIEEIFNRLNIKNGFFVVLQYFNFFHIMYRDS